MLAEVINHGFEVGLIVDYLTFKATPRTRPSLLLPDNKAVIKSFVNTIGLTRFSEYFQNEWKKAQSVTYYFGSVRFVVGANPRDPIDTLIDLLDELDDRRSALKDGEVLAGHHMMHLRSVLMEYSRVKVVPALNELIQMSDVADKTCSGCEFVKKLIDRIGLDNLPPKTRELYKQVFSLN
jgi:hypothetical protein